MAQAHRLQPRQRARGRGAAARAAGAAVGSLLLMVPFLAIAWPVMAQPDVVLVVYTGVQVLAVSMIAATVSAQSARHREGADRLSLAVVGGLVVAAQVLAAIDLATLRIADIQVPWLRWAGLAGFTLGLALRLWAVSANPFFTALVTVQAGAGHHVVETGPYAWVRHPAYLGTLLLLACLPLALGSGLAVLPAALALWRMVIRTRLEDDFLLAQLPGYRAYAGRVRHRVLPGIY
jgi:protein-S-isoprenylcysteine O-methyltransferase Ste14